MLKVAPTAPAEITVEESNHYLSLFGLAPSHLVPIKGLSVSLAKTHSPGEQFILIHRVDFAKSEAL